MIRSSWLLSASLLATAALAQTPAPAPAAAAPPAAASPASGTATAPAPGADVYIIYPHNHETVHSPFVVRFGLKGMGVSPAAAGKIDGTGHHHLLVDTDVSEIDLQLPLPSTDKIIHFGKGQTETSLTLPPGKHTLELLFADSTHHSFDPPLHSKKITITVQ
jgi:pyruvate/2-oxoglutarate dehydrogenase complex dihydrolipoamide acyltransferase (E2) component